MDQQKKKIWKPQIQCGSYNWKQCRKSTHKTDKKPAISTHQRPTLHDNRTGEMHNCDLRGHKYKHTKNPPETKLWNDTLDEEGLRNTMDSWWPNRKHQCYTWINGEKQSWIDHIYVSNNFLQDGTITGAGIDTGKITYKSDHRMVGIRVNFTTMVGKIEGMPKTQKNRPRRSNQLKKKQRSLQNHSTNQRRETEPKQKPKTDSSTGTPNSTR